MDQCQLPSEKLDTYSYWILGPEIFVWIKMFWHTTTHADLISSEGDYMRLFRAPLEYFLPGHPPPARFDYDADTVLKEDMVYHYEHFKMLARDYLMEKMNTNNRYDSLLVTMKHPKSEHVKLDHFSLDHSWIISAKNFFDGEKADKGYRVQWDYIREPHRQDLEALKMNVGAMDRKREQKYEYVHAQIDIRALNTVLYLFHRHFI